MGGWLDIRSGANSILTVLFGLTLIRNASSLGTIVALTAVCMLPPVHVHASAVGPSIVHQHAVDKGADHYSDSLGRHHHRSVQTLKPTFVSSRPFDLDPPLIAAVFVVSAPEPQTVPSVEPSESPRVHGPPRPIGPVRAPPV